MAGSTGVFGLVIDVAEQLVEQFKIPKRIVQHEKKSEMPGDVQSQAVQSAFSLPSIFYFWVSAALVDGGMTIPASMNCPPLV